MKELKVSSILGYIGEKRKEPILSLMEELSKQGRKRAMLIFSDEEKAYRAMAVLCGLPEYDPEMRVASLEIRIGSYDGILAAGCTDNVSALEYVPLGPHRKDTPPLFFVEYVGTA